MSYQNPPSQSDPDLDLQGHLQEQPPAPADEAAPDYIHHGDGHHSHKHHHGEHDHHHHRHYHQSGEQEHQHSPSHPMHEEHPDHETTHIGN